MQLYPKVSEELVFDLINASNPNLPVPLTSSNASLGAVTAIANPPVNGIDTTIKITSKYGSIYRGSRELKYKRIDLTKLFLGTVVRVVKYTVSEINPGVLSNYIEDINTKYGLKLTNADINTAVSFPNYTDVVENGKTYKQTQIVATVLPTSKAYTGVFTIQFRMGLPELSLAITKLELPARQFSNGNRTVTAGDKYTLSCDSYGIDFTEQSADAILVGNLFGNGILGSGFNNGSSLIAAAADRLFATINERRGTAYASNFDDFSTVNRKFSMYNATALRYNLPNAAVPEAKSEMFNRVLVINPSGNGLTWATGRLLIHYNV